MEHPSTPDLNHCKQFLQPHLPLVSDAIYRAMQEVQKALSTTPVLVSACDRTISNLILDRVYEEIKRKTLLTPGWSYRTKDGLPLLLIDELIMLRFNKLGKNGKPITDNKTTQTAIFRYTEQGSLFPDIPERARLYCGYSTTLTGTAIKNIEILCMVGRKIIWKFDASNGSGYDTLSLPLVNDPTPPNKPLATLITKISPQEATG